MTFWLGVLLRDLLLWHLLFCLVICAGVLVHRAAHGESRKHTLWLAIAAAACLILGPALAFFGSIWGVPPMAPVARWVGLLGGLFTFLAAAGWLLAMWQARHAPSGRWTVDVPVVVIGAALGYLMLTLPRPVPFLLISLAT